MSDSLDSKINSVCEKLKAEKRMENEKLAASLTNKFENDHEKVREDISLEVQTVIHDRTK
jgi:hypothetical protein